MWLRSRSYGSRSTLNDAGKRLKVFLPAGDSHLKSWRGGRYD